MHAYIYIIRYINAFYRWINVKYICSHLKIYGMSVHNASKIAFLNKMIQWLFSLSLYFYLLFFFFFDVVVVFLLLLMLLLQQQKNFFLLLRFTNKNTTEKKTNFRFHITYNFYLTHLNQNRKKNTKEENFVIEFCLLLGFFLSFFSVCVVCN